MIRNVHFHSFKSLEDEALDVGAVTVLIGPNAAGKSNAIRAFRFIADAVRSDVESAISRLGGIEGASFWGAPEQTFSLDIEYYVPDPTAKHSRSDMAYEVRIGVNEGRAVVLEERLRIKRKRNEPGRAKIWLRARLGRGEAVRDPQRLEREPFDTGDPGVLALKALGFLDTYPRIRALRRFIEGWQFLSVNLEAVRLPRRDQRTRSLEFDASNLVNVLRTLHGSATYGAILDDLRSLLELVETMHTNVDRGRVLLM